jgi:hypothetical protein
MRRNAVIGLFPSENFNYEDLSSEVFSTINFSGLYQVKTKAGNFAAKKLCRRIFRRGIIQRSTIQRKNLLSEESSYARNYAAETFPVKIFVAESPSD